jgi:hypothetical protein
VVAWAAIRSPERRKTPTVFEDRSCNTRRHHLLHLDYGSSYAGRAPYRDNFPLFWYENEGIGNPKPDKCVRSWLYR